MRGVKFGYRSCGCGPADGIYGPDARPGRHDRGCAGARLSEQSAAQRAARASPLHRRERAAGAIRLSPSSRADRQRRLPVQDTNTTAGGTPTAIVRTEIHGANAPRSAGLTVSQTLYNGQQTANRTRAAESQVSGAREALRVLEQTVLLSAATIYMDYLRDSAIVEVQRSNVRVLEQTLKQTRDRFNVGEVTRTDVAQSEAQLAAGKTQLLTAEATLTTTRANFRRIIGNEPNQLAPGSPVDRYLAGNAAGRGRPQPGRKSERDRRDVRHRRQLSSGQGQRRRAVADGRLSRRLCSSPMSRR